MTRFHSIALGDQLPAIDYQADHIQLFFYNAALWNAHRIHYDQAYAKNTEHYPELVVPGPLLGDYLSQVVTEWLAEDGRLVSIEYSNRQASYVDETLVAGGEVSGLKTASKRCELSLHVKNAAGDVVTPGTAVVEFKN